MPLVLFQENPDESLFDDTFDNGAAVWHDAARRGESFDTVARPAAMIHPAESARIPSNNRSDPGRTRGISPPASDTWRKETADDTPESPPLAPTFNWTNAAIRLILILRITNYSSNRSGASATAKFWSPTPFPPLFYQSYTHYFRRSGLHAFPPQLLLKNGGRGTLSSLFRRGTRDPFDRHGYTDQRLCADPGQRQHLDPDAARAWHQQSAENAICSRSR